MVPSIFGENMLDDFFDGGLFGERNPLYGKNARNLMKTDIRETDDSYEIAVDLPGFKKDEIHLDVKNGYLTVSAEKGLDKKEEDKKADVFVIQSNGKEYTNDDIVELCKAASRNGTRKQVKSCDVYLKAENDGLRA